MLKRLESAENLVKEYTTEAMTQHHRASREAQEVVRERISQDVMAEKVLWERRLADLREELLQEQAKAVAAKEAG